MYLDVLNMKVTIVGAGSVAYRKCKTLVDLGKKVTVIGENILDKFNDFGHSIDIIKANYDTSLIADSFVVIAATDDEELNKSIGEYCMENNKLVNVVDNPEYSNFLTPAFFKKGDLMISVSTSGKSPSLSVKIKNDLEKKYDDEFIEFVDLLGKLRTKIIASEKNIKKRNTILRSLVDMSLDELKSMSVKFNL